MAENTNAKDHPLANILVNVLIPVLALTYLSKDPAFQHAVGKAVHPWHLGPVKALLIAILLPISYGIWHFVKTKKPNFFSAIGLISVILTGSLTIFLWNKDGTIKPNAAVLFGLKEASIPFILGLCVLGSHFTSSPLLRVFLYSDHFFDIPKIENKVRSISAEPGYQKILLHATLLFASSFLISTFLNFFLSIHFLSHINFTASNARELYNEGVAKITGWGFAVIGVPILFFLFFTLRNLIKSLTKLTSLSEDEILLPR